MMSRAKHQADRLFCFAGCAHDEPFVIAQNLEPVLNVSSRIAETACRLKARVIDKSRSADFRNQFFLAV